MVPGVLLLFPVDAVLIVQQLVCVAAQEFIWEKSRGEKSEKPNPVHKVKEFKSCAFFFYLPLNQVMTDPGPANEQRKGLVDII